MGKMMFRGKNVDESMSKVELLEVIEWLSAEMLHYKLSAEETSAILHAEVVKTIGPPPKFGPVAKYVRAKL